MKTTILIRMAITACLIFSIVGKYIYSQSFDPRIKPGINVSVYPLSDIIDSIRYGLEKGFGRPFRLDSTFRQGCLNYAYENAYGTSIEYVPGEAHFHRGCILDFVCTALPPSDYAKDCSDLAQDETFSQIFSMMKPERFWVDTICIPPKCYLIIAIDGKEFDYSAYNSANNPLFDKVTLICPICPFPIIVERWALIDFSLNE